MKKHLLFLALLLFAATSTWALTPVYVNGSTGNNSYDGSSAIVGTLFTFSCTAAVCSDKHMGTYACIR